jgi:hypothetical protein
MAVLGVGTLPAVALLLYLVLVPEVVLLSF